jgi:outer membrane protein assembly factor BamB
LGADAPRAERADRPWRRGGPGSPTPLALEGPEAAPAALWERPLGAAITGAPAFAPVADGAQAAFVGTHSGRFVGVILEGPRAGEIAVDVNVPGMIWGTAARGADGALVFGADNDTLYAVDPATGAIAWSQRIGACDPPRAIGPEGTRCDPDGGPTIAADGAIFVGADGVYRLEATGALRWHYPPADVDPRPRHVGAAPLVTRDGGVVVGGQDGVLVALDRDGGLRWRVELGPDVDAAPVMLKSGVVVAAADDGRVVAIDPAGETRWTFTAGKDVRAPLALAADDTIYAASFDGLLYALRPDGALRWSFTAGGPIASAPVVDAAGRVYFGARDDFLYAVDARGRLRWRVELPEDVDAGVGISDGGVIVVGGDDGVLRALR